MSKQLTVLDPSCCTPLADKALTADQAADVAPVFKALGDPVRLRLFSMVASSGGEVCVCDILDKFDLTQPTISHHLKILREAGLVDCERRGTWVFYWALPDSLAALSVLLEKAAVAA
jgi:ArsR family transcriptional regulator, arsenate/arsenite/antimonite-responsive transcriptional repressor